MSLLQQHLALIPIVLPLVVSAFVLLFDERRVVLKAAISYAGMVAVVAAAVALVGVADETQVYRLGDWSAPFGIVLVADRLAALMVLLSSTVALCTLTFSLARWHRAGPRFHSLFQILVMGVNGAFLTGDLFNLFVFFEVLLAASYGLALHGSGTARVTASLHYIAINLTASLLFLVGASLLYAVTGTLNMADLGARMPAIAAGDRALVEAGAAILGIAFLVKAGMWPLCFWLPRTYAAASAPVSAVFAILTKVGVYSVLRVWLLLFGDDAGASAGFGGEWLAIGGMATLAFGTVGVLATHEMPRLASFSLIVSSGTLLAAIGVGQAALTGAALYYLIASTLGVSAFFLVIELVERGQAPGAALLAVSAEYFGDPEDEVEPEEEVGIAIPATTALLGVSFACCALVIAGLPPFPGFIGKLALIRAGIAPDPVPAAAWAFVALLIAAGFAAVISVGRAGVQTFWAPDARSVPRVRLIEMTPIVVLLALCAALVVYAGPAMRYLDATAEDLHAPQGYIDDVLRGR